MPHLRHRPVHRLLPLLLASVLAGTAACSGGGGDAAASYPRRDVQVVVPYPAGSGIDTTTRALVDVVNKDGGLGKRLQVVNKDGGAGVVGTSAVLSAKPDGYTIGVVPDGPLTLVPQTQKVPYDPTSLTMINEVTVGPIMFVVPGSSPFKDMKDLIEAARSEPGSVTLAEGPLNYSVPAEAVEQLQDVTFKHVKYDGDGATTTALLGDNVDVGVMQLASALPQLASGKLRALGLTSAEPVDLAQDVPTFKDSGIDFTWEAYNWVIAPKGLPEGIASKLTEALTKAEKSEDFADAARKLGVTVSGVGPDEAEQHLRDKKSLSTDILEKQQ